MFTRISSGVYCLTKFLIEIKENDLGYFAEQNNEIVFKSTEKIVKQKIRVGQNKFRNDLLKQLKKCPITQIDETSLLIASHIKPWIHSNNEERLNPNNGFLLSPLFDKLFDNGLITFTSKKEILISKELSNKNRASLNINHEGIIIDLPIRGREDFLEYHRKNIYQG